MICSDCGKTFDDAILRRTTYESYYGVESDVPSRTPLTLWLCPYCESDEIMEEGEYEADEEEEEEEEENNASRKTF